MAVPNSAEVYALRPMTSGGILVGALTAAPPTSATAALTGFTALGFIGDDGLTEGTSRSTDPVKAWGGDTVKTLQTDFTATYSFSFLQAGSVDVLKEIYGADNVTVTAATSTTGTLTAIAVTGEPLPVRSWVFDMKDGDARKRIYVPKGQITEVGDVTYSDSAVVALQVTLTLYSDASGKKVYHYLDNGIHSA